MDTNLKYPTQRPKDLKEWLGLITSAIGDLKGTADWYANPTMTIAAIATALGNDPAFATNILNLINSKFQESKNYADDLIQGIKKRTTVRLATTTNISLAGPQTLDGKAVANGDKVLVKNQTNPAENGIYVVNTSGNWTRDPEFDEAYELESAYAFVREGNTQADTGWLMSTDGAVTIGTTPINFTQFSAAGVIVADNVTTTKTGNVISLKSGVIASPGQYSLVQVDTYGRVTNGVNPANLKALGIKDSVWVGGADLNDITDSGFYAYNSSTQNAPVPDNGYLLVIKHGTSDQCLQFAFFKNLNTFYAYTRSKGSGQWSDWVRFDPDPSIVVRADKPSTMQKAATLSKIANNDSNTYTIIDADARVWRAVYNDLAELFEHSEETEPGDILVSIGGKVARSTKARDRRVVGVHSDTFGFCLGGENKKSPEENYNRYTPVGISGRVLVKITGDVEEGQFITTSNIPGVGIATDEYIPGTIIGKALETHKGKDGVYRVWTLIMNI